MEKKQTPIETAIEQFETLKSKAETFRDVIYLDGVLAVLESLIPTEKKEIQDIAIAFAEQWGSETSINWDKAKWEEIFTDFIQTYYK